MQPGKNVQIDAASSSSNVGEGPKPSSPLGRLLRDSAAALQARRYLPEPVPEQPQCIPTSTEAFAYGRALNLEDVIEQIMLNETPADEAVKKRFPSSERTDTSDPLPDVRRGVEGNMMPTAAQELIVRTEYVPPVSALAEDVHNVEDDYDVYGSEETDYEGHGEGYAGTEAASREEDVFPGFWRPHKLY